MCLPGCHIKPITTDQSNCSAKIFARRGVSNNLEVKKTGFNSKSSDRVNGLIMWRKSRPLPLLCPTSQRTISRRSLLTQSHARGPSHPPLLEQTVGEHFASIVSKFGDRTAFVVLSEVQLAVIDVVYRVISRHQRTRLTYGELDAQSTTLACGLLYRGLKKGDRVAVSLGNSIEYAVVWSSDDWIEASG